MDSVIIPKTIPEKLLYNTIRIVGIVNKEANSIGTGSFFRIVSDAGEHKNIDVILTNKHVVENSKGLAFYFHEGVINNEEVVPTGKSLYVQIDDYLKWWIPHPVASVDLGALLFEPIRKIIVEDLKKIIFQQWLDKTFIRTDSELFYETSVAEEILLIGCPMGLWDDYNNFPIIRKGIASTHPAVDFQNRSVGVVDVTCFRGSSGSPVLTYTASSGRKENENMLKAILLGILSTGPSYVNGTEILLKPLSTIWKPLALNEQMIHLGFYVKAKEILRLSAIVVAKEIIG